MAAAKPPSSFPTPESLSNWLKARLPAEVFASWGIKQGTKNVYNLWIAQPGRVNDLRRNPTLTHRSLRCGSYLERRQEENPPRIASRTLRRLNEAQVTSIVGENEGRQSIEAATLRAVKEELGQKLNDHGSIVTKIGPGSYKIKEEERESGSFPGLASAYVVHTVDAHVEGLPPAEEAEFYTEDEEYKECSDGLNGAVEKSVHVKKAL